MPPLEPIVDANVHLWDSARNPVFWLEDRTLVRDLLGDYDSLPDAYTLADYRSETARLPVRGIVWSDAGAADPVAAAEWVASQDDGEGFVTGLVSLGDPTDPGFGDLVDRLLEVPPVSSVRVRVAVIADREPGAVSTDPDVPYLERPMVMDHVRLLERSGLVATVETTSDQLGTVARLAADLPDLRIVLDHFGWPTDLTASGRAQHLDRLAELAEHTTIATRLDAWGTILGDWQPDDVTSWVRSVVGVFGADRCMLGSDLPIERLRSSVGRLYAAYDEALADLTSGERGALLGGTAERWYARR